MNDFNTYTLQKHYTKSILVIFTFVTSLRLRTDITKIKIYEITVAVTAPIIPNIGINNKFKRMLQTAPAKYIFITIIDFLATR